MKRCINCFRQYENEYTLCPFCGEEEITQPAEPVHLKPGTEIHNGRYVIGLSVGSGGFGVVYRAFDKNLNTVIAIKEFFMPRIMVRTEGETRITVNKNKTEEYLYNKKRFLAEARAMAKFGGAANIPKVFDFFEDNDTAYIAMELFTGVSLRKYLNKQKGKKVDPEFAVYVATEVAKSLKVMHKNNVIHRDIAPDNIFYTETSKGAEIDVIDLGTARLADDTDARVQIEAKNGYTPVEQYDKAQNNIGPWTDIYALGATLYNMLTGIVPAESTSRKTAIEKGECDPVRPPHEIDPSISIDLSNAVMRALAIDREYRLQNTDDFIKAINGEKKVRDPNAEKRIRRWRKIVGIAATLVALVTIGGIVGGLFAKEGKEYFLNPASITVWISVEDGSSEEEATREVINDFMEKYPQIQIELRAISSSEYKQEIENAAKANTLPTLFESTDIFGDVLSKSCSVSNVLASEQAKECLFLEQYGYFYKDEKKIPLAIKVPLSCVVTNGAVKVDYTDKFFTNTSDFGKDTVIAIDSKEKDLIHRNFENQSFKPDELFFDNNENKAAVLLTSTMSINRIREKLTNYLKSYVYYNGKEIICEFTYEWSIGQGDANQIAAAERLLSWMLGNVYQNLLMISRCSDGQIPINQECFRSKIDNKYLEPIRDIYYKFKFVR